MNLRDRFSRLGPREQRILNIALIGVAIVVLVVVPLGLTAREHAKRTENQALQDAIEALADGRDQIERAKQERAVTLQRYAKPAPPLAAFLASLATEAGVDIPESQDRQAIPHGKKYTERSTRIALHRLGMLNLLKFLERIEHSASPVSISALNIRKRGLEPDSYDVEMVVSAFDRNAAVKPATKAPENEEAKQ